MALVEHVYLGHDNSIDLLLTEDGVAIDTSGITSAVLTVGSTKYTSTNQAADQVKWQGVGYATGEVRLFLGDQSLSPRTYTATLVIYTATATSGIVWGELDIVVHAEVGGS